MKATQQLHDLGQSLWLDNITRELLDRGTLGRYIAELSVTGLTSNPTIFEHAIAKQRRLRRRDPQPSTRAGSAESSSSSSSRSRTSRARPICSARSTSARTASTAGSRSRCPRCSRTTPSGTIAEAKRLFERAGAAEPVHQDPGDARRVVPAIEEAIFAGVPVNVTLLFSREHYLAAAEAFVRGIERRIDAGLRPDVASVASLFVSRWDAAVAREVAPALRNRLGIAIAKRTYQAYRTLLSTPRWQRIYNLGGRPQRLFWASTGTKDPEASDVLYVALARGAVHREHDARGDPAGARRAERGRPAAHARRRRLRGGAGRVRARGDRRRRAGRAPPAGGSRARSRSRGTSCWA